MKNTRIRTLPLALATAGVLLAGCADMNTGMTTTQRNTAIGAGVGALAGAAIGHDATGALIGAGIGAAGGYIWSKNMEQKKLAKLAMALTLGVAQDLGGTQPYIPVGAMLLASARAKQAIDMLNARHTYREAAEATGLTEARIRKIEVEWRREEMSRRQGRLQLD